MNYWEYSELEKLRSSKDSESSSSSVQLEIVLENPPNQMWDDETTDSWTENRPSSILSDVREQFYVE